METKPINSPRRRALKQAKKTFKFWYKILLETEYMNDPENRKDFQSALSVIKTECKNTKHPKSLT